MYVYIVKNTRGHACIGVTIVIGCICIGVHVYWCDKVAHVLVCMFYWFNNRISLAPYFLFFNYLASIFFFLNKLDKS